MYMSVLMGLIELEAKTETLMYSYKDLKVMIVFKDHWNEMEMNYNIYNIKQYNIKQYNIKQYNY